MGHVGVEFEEREKVGKKKTSLFCVNNARVSDQGNKTKDNTMQILCTAVRATASFLSCQQRSISVRDAEYRVAVVCPQLHPAKNTLSSAGLAHGG